MIASLLKGGILHRVHVRKDSNKDKAVARVHTVTGEPVQLLVQVKDNTFFDDIENKHYILNPLTRVIVGA